MSLIKKVMLYTCLLGLIIPVAWAEKVYRSVDEKGVVEFSDQGKRGAEELDVPEVPTYQFKKKPATTATPPPPKAEAPAGSIQLQIVSPAEKETIRSNPGDLTVVVELADIIQKGEKIVISLDGKVVSESEQTTVALNNIDRGTHHLKAVLVDAEGKQLAESPLIEFYMKRTSILLKKPANPVKTN